MAGYRQFHTQFWKDEWLIELAPLERYLFSYLFTNELSSISGIYKLPLRVVQNETGLERDFILTTFEKFQEAKKIFYKDGVMWVVNMRKYHKNASPRTMTKVNADVQEIPDCDVKTSYLYHAKTGIYSTDTVCIPRSESVSESVSESESESDDGDRDDSSFGSLCTIYEENIGTLSSMISEELQSDLDQYGLKLCQDAIGEAVKNNVRKWSYVQGILKRWKRDGRVTVGKDGTRVVPPKTITIDFGDGHLEQRTV